MSCYPGLAFGSVVFNETALNDSIGDNIGGMIILVCVLALALFQDLRSQTIEN